MAAVIVISLLILLLASTVWYLWISRNSKGGAPPLPPGPRGLPIVGYLPFVEVNLHKQFSKLAHKHGPIFKLWLGSKLYIVISSPHLVKAVVRDHDSVFANRDPTVAAVVATSALDIFWAPNGPYWRDMRKLFVREMLSSKNLQSSLALRVDEVSKAARELREKMIGEVVVIGDLVFGIEVKVIMNLLWGATVEGEESERVGAEFRTEVSKLVDLLGKPNVSDFFPFLARFDLQGVAKEMRGVVPKIDEIVDWVIEKRMKMMKNSNDGDDDEDDKRKKDILEILLELKDQKVGDEASFGLVQIKAVLMDIIVAGTDTTATTVEWAMAELLNNPNIMQKVQEEVSDVVGIPNAVEESHLPKLKYLEAVVKETMRLHPLLPLIPRFPSQSTTMGGYTVPEGSRVFLNMWSIHMDPQLWEKPAEFEPTRFLNENGNCDYNGNSFQYLPFGSGRRLCPGLPLGERMVMLLLATLVHSFEWRLPDDAGNVDMSETFGMVMRKTKPLLAIPYRRFH